MNPFAEFFTWSTSNLGFDWFAALFSVANWPAVAFPSVRTRTWNHRRRSDGLGVDYRTCTGRQGQ